MRRGLLAACVGKSSGEREGFLAFRRLPRLCPPLRAARVAMKFGKRLLTELPAQLAPYALDYAVRLALAP